MLNLVHQTTELNDNYKAMVLLFLDRDSYIFLFCL